MSESDWSEDDFGPRPPANEQEEIGPRLPPADSTQQSKKQKSDHLSEILKDNLPTGALYEFSFMHQAVVTHVLVSVETEFVMTISAQDGILKFWKKLSQGIEFVKAYACGSFVIDACASANGRDLAVISDDNIIRLFDIENFNLLSTNPIRLQDRISSACFASYPYDSLSSILAVAAGCTVHLIDLSLFLDEPKVYKPKQFSVHQANISLLKFNHEAHYMISVDEEGFMEVWDPTTRGQPSACKFESKFDTDLFDLKKDETGGVALAVSATHFAVLTKTALIKLFRISDCKLVKVIDECIETLVIAQNDPTQRAVHLDAKDLASRVERETTLDAVHPVRSSMLFDESGEILVYSTVVGIKYFHLKSNALLSVVGKVELTERFVNLALYQGKPKLKVQELTAGGAPEFVSDPCLVCTALDSERFYVFSKRLPGEQRDVFNEPTAEERSKSGGIVRSAAKRFTVATKATIFTTKGDIIVELLPKECKRTVENFATHARNGYYDSVIFHRVIKNFMIQTGDPNGDGSGGTSIWGRDFDDEISPNLRHDKPYMLSMANTGSPNTNGSQFFITTVAAPWLDNKHTIFGRVTAGIDVVRAIEELETDDNGKPRYEDVRILSIKIS